MKFVLPILAVTNTDISRRFYEKVLRQHITLDLGEYLVFDNSFAIQENYIQLIDVPNLKLAHQSNDHALYFEEEHFDQFEKHLEKFEQLEYLHKTREYPWGQKIIRFYDPDQHIITVAESMKYVFNRFLNQGMSIEQVAAKTMHPIESIKKIIAE